MTDPIQADPAAFLTFGGDLTIHCAAERGAELLAALCSRLETEGARAAPVALDLSGVSDVDSAGIQLLLAARRFCEREAQGLQLAATAPSLQAALDAFGLDDHLHAGHPAAPAAPALA